MLNEQFLDYFKSEKNCSEQTITSYGLDLREFEEFFKSLDKNLTWTTVDETIIREWVIFMLDERNMKNSSVNRKLSTLRSFYHYLIKRGIIDTNPTMRVTGPKREKVLPAFVRTKEMDELIDMLDAAIACTAPSSSHYISQECAKANCCRSPTTTSTSAASR